MNIEISDRSTGHWVPDAARCRSWLEPALRGARRERPVTVSLCFVDADEAEQLNRRYRGRPHPADVLAFPSAMPATLRRQLDSDPLGDIVVCAELARREALCRDRPVDHHWAHLVIHGCLHLLGYDHTAREDAANMEKIEIEILRNLGIPNPYGHSM